MRNQKAKNRPTIYVMYEGGAVRVEVKWVGEKENEISGLPDYLKQFNLVDTIVTMDAMGCK